MTSRPVILPNLTQENMYAPAILAVPVLQVGALTHGSLLEAFATLRNDGCDVEWADRRRGLLSHTYYNVRIAGPAIYIEAFGRWINHLANN